VAAAKTNINVEKVLIFLVAIFILLFVKGFSPREEKRTLLRRQVLPFSLLYYIAFHTVLSSSPAEMDSAAGIDVVE
jgi:hypothetical protein